MERPACGGGRAPGEGGLVDVGGGAGEVEAGPEIGSVRGEGSAGHGRGRRIEGDGPAVGAGGARGEVHAGRHDGGAAGRGDGPAIAAGRARFEGSAVEGGRAACDRHGAAGAIDVAIGEVEARERDVGAHELEELREAAAADGVAAAAPYRHVSWPKPTMEHGADTSFAIDGSWLEVRSPRAPLTPHPPHQPCMTSIRHDQHQT